MTRYQRIVWKHEFQDEPVILYSEVSDEGVETRKVEQYRDGRMDYAGPGQATGSTLLSEKTMPGLTEIAAQPEFTALAITHDEFEEVWRRATQRS